MAARTTRQEARARIMTLKIHAERLEAPQSGAGPDHPRRVLANNVGYFQAHRHHMDYPEFRRRGWPIGSGVTESAVKQFNKRVKGSEQFWSLPGVESILGLRSLCLSQDDRWPRYWNTRPTYSNAAQTVTDPYTARSPVWGRGCELRGFAA